MARNSNSTGRGGAPTFKDDEINKSLRRKFKNLRNTPKKTGSAKMPPFVKRAKEIYKEIEHAASVATLGDETASGESGTDSEGNSDNGSDDESDEGNSADDYLDLDDENVLAGTALSSGTNLARSVSTISTKVTPPPSPLDDMFPDSTPTFSGKGKGKGKGKPASVTPTPAPFVGKGKGKVGGKEMNKEAPKRLGADLDKLVGIKTTAPKWWGRDEPKYASEVGNKRNKIDGAVGAALDRLGAPAPTPARGAVGMSFTESFLIREEARERARRADFV
ncbi:hypothetical protein GGF32_006496 [Allomyces javanicus]|nr:hypothetical protein GGF32_006496 [Allomyces javanicus]